MKNVYKFMVENLMGRRIDKIVVRNKRYRKANKKYTEALKKCEELSLSKKDDRVVDNALNTLAAQDAVYSELAYRQGMKDAVRLLKDIGIIGK